jgi:peptide/nickel transport system substrate-binding protein
LDDKRVRQALAYAIDYERITEQLGLGYYEPLYARPFLPPFEGTPGYGAFDHIQGYEYNPEKAKALLEEAGQGDGFSITIDTIEHQSDKAQVIAQMWGDIGIDASVRLWEFAVMSATWRQEVHNRDVYLSRYSNMDRFPDYIAKQVTKGSSQNRAKYDNPYAEELLARASSLEDSPERNATFCELFEIVLDDVPCIFITAEGKIEGWHKKVKNNQPCIRVYINADRLDLDTEY